MTKSTKTMLKDWQIYVLIIRLIIASPWLTIGRGIIFIGELIAGARIKELDWKENAWEDKIYKQSK